ncbi:MULTISPECIES: hypothetical protein [Caproicibacterium]|uniref:DUF4315 family protein n=2 Tax=Caproicibacterium TaxID=2834348 RepID=A0A7G9WJM5_9FIRM|nr:MULTISPECIES: hypothetical protein [Caproicibacterium]QNO18887.1 hypothetical protein H6X83_04460 [Caproicibacterium amylolyticum]WOC32880.1 hypothetical protein PXC00_03110 [Caproicibacterium argilliputei]
MNSNIDRLEQSIQAKIKKRDALTEQIKSDEARLKKMKNAEIVNQVNALADGGVDMPKVMEAIREKDLDALLTLITEKGAAND